MRGTSKGNISGKFQLMSAMMLIGLIGLGGCATANVNDEKITYSKADPYEKVNRNIYVFNDTVDDYFAKPIADVYRAITPQFVQTGIFNFYNNLKNVNTIVNDIFQGKFEQSVDDTGRLIVNSTVGLMGIVDAASSLGLEQNDEDFDQTLAVWGVPRGPYLVLPFAGPTTVRGIPGAVFDTAANPSTYVGAPVQLLSLLNARANAEGSLKFIDEAALDPYLFTRESFLQWRQNLASDGQFQSMDGFDEFDEGDDTSLSETTSFRDHAVKFSEASKSFESVTQSFDKTTNSFQHATYKLHRLSEQ